ncbi:glycosyltransferase family 4 protein [Aureimonas sp. ME7]|uniref:glycosyltransferase family 4 protein n=1 Tax=Aureimonas sp. ME7 TaxID=2744252 RepID=UPI001AEEB364|nr:glycosyltransferase family 4 protein [Aureimonas sp. ME7]
MTNEPPRPAIPLGYFLNTYPAPSATFIRNEIEALEALGHRVSRFAVRRFPGALVDPADLREQRATTYLMEGSKANLIASGLRELLTRPLAFAKGLGAALGLLRQARGGVLRHAAYLLQAASLRQKAARLGIAHIHSHYGTNPAAVAMLCRTLGGPSYSFTAHGPDEFVGAEGHGFRTKIERSAFTVAITDHARALLEGLARKEDRGRIVTVRCGLDLPRFQPAPPVEAGNRVLVCVGRLCPAKGQVHIPAAVAALTATLPDIRVLLVGDGESRPQVERAIAEHGVGEQVILHGWARGDEVRALLASSRALLLPSYAEGLPIVIMEAFALGRPVITTTIAGIPELVDDSCGWLIPPGDVAALTRAMEAALRADLAELSRMGLAGRARVERLHDRNAQGAALSRHFAERT